MGKRRKTRVIICGAGYGETYAQAIRLGADQFELVGIVGAGGERSRALAARQRVPLYHGLAELTRPVDLACVAVGTEGAAVALTVELLKRGVHVVGEHPLSPVAVIHCKQAAQRAGAHFHVNSHFADLPAPRLFIQQCALMRQNGLEPSWITCTANRRTIFSLLDIIGQSFGTTELRDIEQGRKRGSRPTIAPLILTFATGMEVTVEMQLFSSRHDDGTDQALPHRITVGYPTGVLSLVHTFGPLIWNYSFAFERLARLSRHSPLWQVLSTGTRRTFAQCRRERIQANLMALERMRRQMRASATLGGQSTRYLVDLSTAWVKIEERLQAWFA